MTGKLTTHVLDTAKGCPAAGLKIELWKKADSLPSLLGTWTTNADGRCNQPLLHGPDLLAGDYELRFYVGDYFGEKKFLNIVPICFTISDPAAHYHIPLLASPWAYSTYRGS
jgi:5-hydroxyisourate hydrolase